MTAAKHDRVAKRYARALFEVCQPTEFDATAAQLKVLASVWSGSPEFRQSMLNPSVQDNTRAEIVDSLVKSLSSVSGVNGWANQATERTVQTLVSLRKAAIFPAELNVVGKRR
jgi:F0F1-type ATP synthase delta subunit